MSDLSDLECDMVAETIKAMLRHRPIERTDDAIWRSAIRFGLVKASIVQQTLDAGGVPTPWNADADKAAFDATSDGCQQHLNAQNSVDEYVLDRPWPGSARCPRTSCICLGGQCPPLIS